MKLWITTGATAALFLMFGMPEAEAAYRSRLKVCADAWAAAKTAGKVREGQSWEAFYRICSARLQEKDPSRPASVGNNKGVDAPMRAVSPPPVHADPAASVKTVPPPAGLVRDEPATAPGKPQARLEDDSARSRQQQCAAQWRALKAAGQVPEGQKWPQFWSACNARLKKGR